MKRGFVLGAIVLSGALATAVAQLGAQAPGAAGQGRGGGGRGAAPPVGAIEKIADNLYTIPFQGGNTAVFVTANGVVLVDTKNPNNGEAILEQVRTVTKLPVTHIINTHTHGDHTGSNIFFPPTVEIVTHQNTAANMKRMPAFQDAANQHGLPDRTYQDRLTVLSGNDSIDLYHFGPAHTDGDTFVVFRNARVLHAGDVFAQKGWPFVDTGNGGNHLEYGETIGKAISGVQNVDRVITGHITGPDSLQRWQDLADYGEFNRLVVAHARASLKAGQTPEQAAATLKLPDKFSGYTLAGGRGGAAGNFPAIFEALKGAN